MLPGAIHLTGPTELIVVELRPDLTLLSPKSMIIDLYLDLCDLATSTLRAAMSFVTKDLSNLH